jgi:hypothetical protein
MAEYRQVWSNSLNGHARRRIYVSADEGGWLVEAKQGVDCDPQRSWVVPDDKLPLLLLDLMGPEVTDPNTGWREIGRTYRPDTQPAGG